MALSADKGVTMIVSGQTFQLPSEGSVQAVLAEVVDLGIIESTWNGQTKKQHKLMMTFEIEERTDKDERMIVSRWFTASLSDKANLRAFLEAWRGKKFTADELNGFDLSKLIGINALLSLTHNTSNEKTYCNIAAAIKLPKGMPLIALSDDYVPYKDRMAKREQAAQTEQSERSAAVAQTTSGRVVVGGAPEPPINWESESEDIGW
jgi:hypothetical protein